MKWKPWADGEAKCLHQIQNLTSPLSKTSTKWVEVSAKFPEWRKYFSKKAMFLFKGISGIAWVLMFVAFWFEYEVLRTCSYILRILIYRWEIKKCCTNQSQRWIWTSSSGAHPLFSLLLDEARVHLLVLRRKPGKICTRTFRANFCPWTTMATKAAGSPFPFVGGSWNWKLAFTSISILQRSKLKNPMVDEETGSEADKKKPLAGSHREMKSLTNELGLKENAGSEPNGETPLAS